MATDCYMYPLNMLKRRWYCVNIVGCQRKCDTFGMKGYVWQRKRKIMTYGKLYGKKKRDMLTIRGKGYVDYQRKGTC